MVHQKVHRKVHRKVGGKTEDRILDLINQDNTMESFWGTLKSELVYHSHYKTRQEAIREITEYIEVFYNRQRTQARRGYLSPATYERQYYAMQMAA